MSCHFFFFIFPPLFFFIPFTYILSKRRASILCYVCTSCNQVYFSLLSLLKRAICYFPHATTNYSFAIISMIFFFFLVKKSKGTSLAPSVPSFH